MNRSSLIRLGLAAAFASCALPAVAQEKMKMRFDFLPTWRHAAFHLAAEKGWFKEAGLDITLDDGTGSAVSVQMVEAGEYDVVLAALSVMSVARGKGAKVKAIGATLHRNDLGVIVDKTLGIKTLKDLETKNVSINFETGSFQSLFKPFFRNGGTDVAKLRLTSVSPAVAITQYVAGDAGAVITAVPYVLPLVEDKRPSDTFMFADYGLPLPSHGLVASEETIAKRPEALRKFLSASAKGWEALWSGGPRAEEAVDAFVRARPQAKIDRQLVLRQVEAYRPYSTTKEHQGKSVLWMVPQDWDKAVAAMSEAELIPAASKASDFYTNALISQ